VQWGYWKGIEGCWIIGGKGVEDDVEERSNEDVKHVERGHVARYGWLIQFLSFLCFGLNYFIANNFFYFFTKISDFFSLQIKTWIIWFGHRKKPNFSLS